MMGLAMLVLAGCSSAKPAEDVPSATVATAPATTTTTDPYAVPAVIDEAYVNRVLAGLDAVSGDVVRLMVRTKTIPREAVNRLRAIYEANDVFDRVLDSLSRDVAFRLPGFRSEPGNKKSRVIEVLGASTSCIFARVTRDYTDVAATSPTTDDIQWIAIRPLDRAKDPSGYNTTGWAYIFEGFREGRLPPSPSPCAS